MDKQIFLIGSKNERLPNDEPLAPDFLFLKKPIIFIRVFIQELRHFFNRNIARGQSFTFFPAIMARHQSVLRRKLGNSDPRLQEQKITNLKRACEDLNGLIIQPGQIFSLWDTLGNPTYRRGYVDGMLLSGNEVQEGVGGGLCQMANFLCWLFLHADTAIAERYHHSMDLFPDSGRVLPFGSGATCLYNFVDLKIKNTGPQPMQLQIWVSDTHLKGRLLSPIHSTYRFSVREKNHCFVKQGKRYFRYNEIHRIKLKNGHRVSDENVFTNFAPVFYKVTPEYLEQHHFTLIDLSPAPIQPNSHLQIGSYKKQPMQARPSHTRVSRVEA